MEGIEPDAHGFFLGARVQELTEAQGWSALGLEVPALVVSEAREAQRADGSDISLRATLDKGLTGEDVTGGDPSRYRGKLAPHIIVVEKLWYRFAPALAKLVGTFGLHQEV